MHGRVNVPYRHSIPVNKLYKTSPISVKLSISVARTWVYVIVYRWWVSLYTLTSLVRFEFCFFGTFLASKYNVDMIMQSTRSISSMMIFFDTLYFTPFRQTVIYCFGSTRILLLKSQWLILSYLSACRPSHYILNENHSYNNFQWIITCYNVLLVNNLNQ